MKTINLEKLVKENKAFITEIDENKNYLIVISDSAITKEALRSPPERLKNCTFMLVYGKPNEVVSMYEIKK